ncbi:MAG TPA: type 2 isopentenyl-diphosphate Delta-isomerase [Solirubrobacteraceae bacterium]|nr:type 2 isopentenyl-diphosphate Delta-isomerase [Solirubrobacteraceae bacterium]
MTSPGQTATSTRKDEHLELAARSAAVHEGGTGLERLRLRHRALPERDLADVALDTVLLGRRLAAPLLISAMTGGTARAAEVNRRLARAAAEHGIGMALGSGRVLLEDASLVPTFFDGGGGARPPLLMANLGAAQLREPRVEERADRLVTLLEADALVVHLNPLQEAVQPEGQPRFARVADAIRRVADHLAPLPVVAKEVGFGMHEADVALLRDAGVAAVDVAGAGGTNWATVEGLRSEEAARTAAAFGAWGIPTAEAVRRAARAAPGLTVVASGGLHDGVDAAKCLALGASAAGFARPLLLAARADYATEWLATVLRQLRIAVWLAGVARPADLTTEHLDDHDRPTGR